MNNQFREAAALVGEPVRATILWTLLDGKPFTATELALVADTSPSNISMHLAKLLNAGLLKVVVQGRHRYYTLSGNEIAHAIEALGTLIPHSSKKPATATRIEPAIQHCRTCYDHLAGKIGVAITDALLKKGYVTGDEHQFALSGKGKKWFLNMGIPIEELREQRRSFLRPCLDWSERRYHMAGSLATALMNKMLREDWIRKTKNSRAVVVTGKGQKRLYEILKVVV